MKREFVENGWRFRVTKMELYDYTEVRVQFYDNSLNSPSVDDVFSVTESTEYEETVTKERAFLGHTLWTYQDTEKRWRSVEDTVEAAMDRAWDKIAEIDESPSETFEKAVTEGRNHG